MDWITIAIPAMRSSSEPVARIGSAGAVTVHSRQRMRVKSIIPSIDSGLNWFAYLVRKRAMSAVFEMQNLSKADWH
jgi:hypothetical protein